MKEGFEIIRYNVPNVGHLRTGIIFEKVEDAENYINILTDEQEIAIGKGKGERVFSSVEECLKEYPLSRLRKLELRRKNLVEGEGTCFVLPFENKSLDVISSKYYFNLNELETILSKLESLKKYCKKQYGNENYVYERDGFVSAIFNEYYDRVLISKEQEIQIRELASIIKKVVKEIDDEIEGLKENKENN